MKTLLKFVLLFFIFSIITATAYSLVLVKQNQVKKAKRFDMIAAQVVLSLYLLLNFYFIYSASKA